MGKRLEDLEAELRAAGHQVERTFEAPVGSRQEFSDAEWVVRVDGKVIARGGAVGVLRDELAKWMGAREG
jgi:hypothetical protein